MKIAVQPVRWGIRRGLGLLSLIWPSSTLRGVGTEVLVSVPVSCADGAVAGERSCVGVLVLNLCSVDEAQRSKPGCVARESPAGCGSGSSGAIGLHSGIRYFSSMSLVSEEVLCPSAIQSDIVRVGGTSLSSRVIENVSHFP